MVQKGTKLIMLDNCGASIGRCIHIHGGYRKKYGNIGSIITVSVIKLRKIRGKKKTSAKLKLKVNLGTVARAIIVETRRGFKDKSGNSISFLRNACVMLHEKNKIAGSRVFSPILKTFRTSGYSRLIHMGNGIVKF